MFSVQSFQLYCVVEIFHNEVGENLKVLIYCGVKGFGLYSGIRELMNDFESYKIGILEENEI